METTPIVVGTDGSAHSQYALRWAAREAQRRNASLRVLFGYNWPWSGNQFETAQDIRQVAQEQAEQVIANAIGVVREVAPQMTVTGAAITGEPVQMLVEASKHAVLTVVGNRGHGGFTSLLLGAVGQRVATHAAGPVVVVRGRADTDRGPIVVGVDGSPAAAEALGVAFEMAASRGCELTAVNAYAVPHPPWGVDVAPLTYVRAEVEAEARKGLEQALTPWREKYPDVKVGTLVARGSAAQVLVGASHGSQLVVVGSRGHGDLAGTIIGSVGLQLLHHADCPVLVVRPHPAS